MKTLFKLKTVLLLLMIGILFSCKNNKDGYSDEIETDKTTVDTAGTISDSASSNNGKDINATGSNAPTVTNGSNSNASTAGTGSGPGENAGDGSTYTSSSDLRKDSINSKGKNAKDKGK